MAIGAVIIGDEILAGRRQDKHLAFLVNMLKERGLLLDWCLILGDKQTQLIDFYKRSLAGDEIVFSFGGIGGTPDDVTRQCVAAAMGVELEKHPDAVSEIEKQFGEDAYPQRIKMAYLPLGSHIIPNPVNRIPGFSVGKHHFFPGFPQMSWPMAEWVFDRYYPHLVRHDAPLLLEFLVENAREGSLMSVMNRIVAHFPDVTLSSLPSYDDTGFSVTLGLYGEPEQVRRAAAEMIREIELLGFSPEPVK